MELGVWNTMDLEIRNTGDLGVSKTRYFFE